MSRSRSSVFAKFVPLVVSAIVLALPAFVAAGAPPAPASASAKASVSASASASVSVSASGSASVSALDKCLGCHGDKTKIREDASIKKESVYVDRNGLGRSEHRGLVCTDCHAKGFTEDPHPAARRAICPDCHAGNSDVKNGVMFGDIIDEFEKSVHKGKTEKFRCIHCHDAHTFQLDTTRARVFEHNKTCLRCHGSYTEFGKFADDKKPPDLDKAHEWLPNRDMHWAKIRCLDCHTGYNPQSSHLILAKDKAVKKCETCHTAQPVQLLRLYSRRRQTEMRELGFLNATIINDAYVIGATRNAQLDFWFMLIIGGAIAGISGHGMLRMIAALVRKRSGHGSHGDHK